MSYTRKLITERLGSKGLLPVEIPRFIKDVGNIISRPTYFSTNCIKTALENLGWENNIADNYILEMILITDCEESKTTE
ncbi:hypothetical protein QUF70_10420 [Desulfobacterales bacterium HSG17]|nr:hypothetical protein [Desulfobacterales bacterium HSG17]